MTTQPGHIGKGRGIRREGRRLRPRPTAGTLAACGWNSTSGRSAAGTRAAGTIVDLGAGPDSKIYVVELAKASWLQVELNGATEGALFVQYPGRHHEGGYNRELARGKLSLPGGVGVSEHGDVYVSSPVFGPGSVAKVRH